MTTPTQVAQRTLSPAELAALLALVDAQSGVRRQLTDTAINAAIAAFSAVTNWWDAKQVDQAITATLRVVQPSQRQAARITDAYLARAATMLTGRTVAPVGTIDIGKLRRDMSERVARDLVEGRREPAYVVLGELDPDNRRVIDDQDMNAQVEMAVPDPTETVSQRIRRLRAQEEAAKALEPAEAYGRVADGYRYQVIANGATPERARRYALARLSSIAETDVTLAVREQVRRSVGKIPGVTGYRRVIRPELSQSGPCGLCVVAANRVYKVDELKPIHDRCKCEVLPIIGEKDPGFILNQSDLDALYELAGRAVGGPGAGPTTAGKALKRIRVALAEHGELGPILVDARQSYRGPKKVAETKVPERPVRARAQLEALEKTLPKLLARRAAGEQGLGKAIAWQRAAIEDLRRELAGAA